MAARGLQAIHDLSAGKTTAGSPTKPRQRSGATENVDLSTAGVQGAA